MNLLLTLYLTSGAIFSEPISQSDCRDLMGAARYADAAGATLSHDSLGPIAALKCDGQAIVLMLPASSGDCEVGASS